MNASGQAAPWGCQLLKTLSCGWTRKQVVPDGPHNP